MDNTTDTILSLIPQRPPFVMVSQLVSCDETSTRTTFLVQANNVLVNNGELSEAGLAENIAQTAAAGAGYKSLQNGGAVLTGYIGAIKNLEIFALPKVGDTIETLVTIENQVFDITMVAGVVTCQGAPMATCQMKIFIQHPNT